MRFPKEFHFTLLFTPIRAPLFFKRNSKRPSRGVLRKRCSENTYQIYKRLTICSPVNLLYIFSILFPKNTSRELLLKFLQNTQSLPSFIHHHDNCPCTSYWYINFKATIYENQKKSHMKIKKYIKKRHGQIFLC